LRIALRATPRVIRALTRSSAPSATVLAKQDCVLAGIGCVGAILDVYAHFGRRSSFALWISKHPSVF